MTQNGGKVVSLTHRPFLHPGNTPGTHFCYRLSRAQGHIEIWRIMSMKNSIDTIWNRTSEFQICCYRYLGNYRVKMTYHKASVTRILVKVRFRQAVSTGNTECRFLKLVLLESQSGRRFVELLESQVALSLVLRWVYTSIYLCKMCNTASNSRWCSFVVELLQYAS